MKKAIEMEVPSLPNFIRTKRTEGEGERTAIDVKDFTDDELRELGSEWTEALIEHAKKRRENS